LTIDIEKGNIASGIYYPSQRCAFYRP